MSIPVYDSEKMQAWDQYTISHEPIASIDLMERAATLATKVILGSTAFQSVSIFCGPGNNGGDGLVIARLLHQQKKSVSVYLLRFGADSADFKTNRKKLPKTIPIRELSEKNHTFQSSDDLIIDAVFGSGLNRPVSGWIAQVIDEMNRLEAQKIAIDIPSGLMAKDNHKNTSFPHVFKAAQTLTFMAPKMPFFFSSYAPYVGHVRILDIGLHPDFQDDPIAKYITAADISIKKRDRFDHKNRNGVLHLIGGFEDMSGAAIIASTAAMKSGCGYLFTTSGEKSRLALNVALPEAIWRDSAAFNIPEKVDAIAIGPGLGQSELSTSILQESMKSGKPMLIDADAINLIATDQKLLDLLPANAILTPHVGELKRLIGDFESEEELLEAQLAFSKRHKVYLLQKGAYSKLTTPEGKIHINSSGNPGMGTAGMGDALSGIIGSLLAQGYTAEQAVIYGTFLHGYAADRIYVNLGEYGWTASDVIKELPHTINSFTR
ncbi:MAG: NAD(P)H-hydrate dehydratase [Crocinitomicaceae bacterium]